MRMSAITSIRYNCFVVIVKNVEQEKKLLNGKEKANSFLFADAMLVCLKN